jgi:3,4-dihydroxy-2-butanone 4-phosphate synthase
VSIPVERGPYLLRDSSATRQQEAESERRVEAAIAAVSRGEFVVVVDDENRENEGDLIMAAEFATAAKLNFMITYGRGLVCVAITPERAYQLRLPPMVRHNEDYLGTAFTVSVDGNARHGVTTGISAADRAVTTSLLVHGEADDLRRPGHMFPLIARGEGVIARQGHTEAAVELASLAGAAPVGLLVEIIRPDGAMARLPELVEFSAAHQLELISIDDIVRYVVRTGRRQWTFSAR